MALDTGDWVKIIAAIVGLSYPLLEKLWKASTGSEGSNPDPEPPPRPRPAPIAAAPPRAPAPGPVRTAAPAPPARREPSAAQKQLADTLEKLAQDAIALGEPCRHEPAGHRFVEVLTTWLPKEARGLKEAVLKGQPGLDRDHVARANWLLMVFQEVEEQLRQRRDRALLPLLGDADALAERCYAPVIDFARAEGLELSSARPVTRLSDFDLAIWTGFAPTSLAPIFLPPAFFDSVWYWPAVAHEIGHDFLVSVDGLRDGLAAELGLPPESTGTLPLRLNGNQLEATELWRLYGGWFEELFCDVFGTLMCGPAYAATMVELFGYEQDPREVLLVARDGRSGRYDPHPPRHMRVDAACMVLERSGFSKEAAALRTRWVQRNQLDAEQGVPLLFWVNGSYVYLPYSAFEPLTRSIVERLYTGPLDALNGFGLEDISGLDYGPHQHADAGRARNALLSGAVPRIRDVRAIISGAVLAVLEARDQHTRILELARKAIPAVGTHEHAPGGFDQEAARTAGGLELSGRAVAEALLLGELMERRRPTLSRRAAGGRR